jgi:hypothetical protein
MCEQAQGSLPPATGRESKRERRILVISCALADGNAKDSLNAGQQTNAGRGPDAATSHPRENRPKNRWPSGKLFIAGTLRKIKRLDCASHSFTFASHSRYDAWKRSAGEMGERDGGASGMANLEKPVKPLNPAYRRVKFWRARGLKSARGLARVMKRKGDQTGRELRPHLPAGRHGAFSPSLACARPVRFSSVFGRFWFGLGKCYFTGENGQKFGLAGFVRFLLGRRKPNFRRSVCRISTPAWELRGASGPVRTKLELVKMEILWGYIPNRIPQSPEVGVVVAMRE